LRILSWNFPKEREEAERLCAYILKKYQRAMEVEHSMDSKVTYTSAISAYLPSEQVDFLWSGNETFHVPLQIDWLNDLLY
jgi:hypothetical protein